MMSLWVVGRASIIYTRRKHFTYVYQKHYDRLGMYYSLINLGSLEMSQLVLLLNKSNEISSESHKTRSTLRETQFEAYSSSERIEKSVVMAPEDATGRSERS